MPPKRGSWLSSSQPALKMIKVCSESPELEPDPAEQFKFRIPETSRYSPFLNHETEDIEIDDETVASSGIRTDTISLLMKIEQLEAQLRYERRCRQLAEKELREMKEMNALMMQMRHTAHELRVTLDQVMQGRNDNPASTANVTMATAVATSAMPQYTHEENMSFLATPEPDGALRMLPHITEDDDNLLYLAENLRVPKDLYERVAEISDFRKYTSALLMILFDRETLATHSLQGRRANITGDECQKPQLPPEIMRSIMDHVALKFGVERSQIKTAIRTKLNNEDKLMKRRLGLSKAESKACVDVSVMAENAELTNTDHL